MEEGSILKPEDELFKKVALLNGLVTARQVAQCSRMLGGGGGASRRSLAELLVAMGYIEPEKAVAVEAALRKRAESVGRSHGGALSAQGRGKSKRKPVARGPGQSLMAARRGRASSGESREEVGNDALRRIVAKLAPGRLFPEMLEHIARNKVSVIDPKALAVALSARERHVVKALKVWQRAGVLRAIGTHPYNFSPTSLVGEELDLLLEVWRDPKRHAAVLAMILEHE